jgi:uncharacterized membrane protein YjjB (DUF3815 family)
MSTILWEVLQDAFFAALAGIGFAMLSNPPVRCIFVTAFLAAFAHGIRYLLIHACGVEISMATLIVSFCVGLLGIPFAHWVHNPPVVFTFPSLLPMIPGVFAYKTVLGMIKFINETDTNSAQEILLSTVQNGMKATFILLSLAVGVSLPMLILGKKSVKSTRLSVLLKKSKKK